MVGYKECQDWVFSIRRGCIIIWADAVHYDRFSYYALGREQRWLCGAMWISYSPMLEFLIFDLGSVLVYDSRMIFLVCQSILEEFEFWWQVELKAVSKDGPDGRHKLLLGMLGD